eukprot:4831139-Pyramimonas_sp.AAC.1
MSNIGAPLTRIVPDRPGPILCSSPAPPQSGFRLRPPSTFFIFTYSTYLAVMVLIGSFPMMVIVGMFFRGEGRGGGFDGATVASRKLANPSVAIATVSTNTTVTTTTVTSIPT